MVPFTPSHVAAVLPLRGRDGLGLPLAALAAGSMSPDLPYFQPFVNWRLVAASTHSAIGILTWDLLFGLALWIVWRAGATALHGLAPHPIRRRWQPAAWPATAGAWLLVVAAVPLGAVTHVLWDAFTHVGGFGATQIPAIGATYAMPWGPFPGYRLLQYASGATGLAIVIWVGLRQPTRDPGPRPQPRLARVAAWLVPLSAVAAAAIGMALHPGTDMRALGFIAVTAAIGAATTVVALLSFVLGIVIGGPSRPRPTR